VQNPNLVFDVSARKWDGTSVWTSTTGSHSSTAINGVTKESKAGHDSVLINSDSSYVDWGNFKWGTDVYPESSLEVFVYINTYPNNFNWLVGFMPATHCMRYISLNDNRIGGVGPSCMGLASGGYGMTAPPLNTWVQIVAVYDGSGNEHVVVDGKQSVSRPVMGGSTINKSLRLGSPLPLHTVDANVAEVRVYNKMLSQAEIDASRNAFNR